MRKFKKPPIVYQGNKYRLLKKIDKFFPKDIDRFVDLFGGSSCMALNYGKKAIYNEKNAFISKMIALIYTQKDRLQTEFDRLVAKYELPVKTTTQEVIDKFKVDYNRLREDVNKMEQGSFEHIAGVYTLHIYSINNLLRFNKKGEFNASAGFKPLNAFRINKLKEFEPRENILFLSLDFEAVMMHSFMTPFKSNFFYADPPYLNTTAVYNENRLTSWTIRDDKRLHQLLEMADKMGHKFALSSTLVGKDGTVNEHIKEFGEKFNINYIDHKYGSFGNSNEKNVEVLITNYKTEEHNLWTALEK